MAGLKCVPFVGTFINYQQGNTFAGTIGLMGDAFTCATFGMGYLPTMAFKGVSVAVLGKEMFINGALKMGPGLAAGVGIHAFGELGVVLAENATLQQRIFAQIPASFMRHMGNHADYRNACPDCRCDRD